jgi:Tfp pilus assembly protein PilV
MKRLGTDSGISLIEVTFAFSLFAAVATALSTSIATNIKLSNESRTLAAGAALAQTKLEQLRLTAPVTNTMPADLTLGTHLDPGNPLTATGGTNGTFTRRWVVSGVPQYLNGTVVGSRAAMVEVAVTVSWTTPTAGSQTAVTYVCTTPYCG